MAFYVLTSDRVHYVKVPLEYAKEDWKVLGLIGTVQAASLNPEQPCPGLSEEI